MLKYRIGNDVDYIRLIELFTEAGWEEKTKDFSRLLKMVENSECVMTAWDYDYMVGFARLTSDEVFNAQINNVVVDKEYRRQGIGKELVTRMIEDNPMVTVILRADPDNEAFYKALGFEPAESAYVYCRKA